jgi:lysophospholipase L1-like esterase
VNRWHTFVAIGDSFTEGLDDWRPDGTPRGWADRVAERLAVDEPGFRYANLAVRGKVLDQIVEDQIPVAERLRPDLVAFCAGGNDIIRFSCDTDDLARRFDAALAASPRPAPTCSSSPASTSAGCTR